ncbi:Hypothetical predicted protein [Mytilus galloprovincialis]|uniref:Uncharacterized protein n=1 Tax=Mytilus galloprovincialis TaxID=29158 RepID=A0A8B6BFQ4_MYTGA|nr:Hypothetical predicted protein [Mytilus galloprovincialis]
MPQPFSSRISWTSTWNIAVKDAVRIVMPEEESSSRFHNHKKMMRVPFAIYADFECFTEKLDTCQPDSSHSYTKAYQLQRPSGFCYHIKYAHGDYKDPVVYCGEDAARNSCSASRRKCGPSPNYTRRKSLWR